MGQKVESNAMAGGMGWAGAVSAALDLLACPACVGSLDVSAEELVCGGCGLFYPVVDGIAVLLVERARRAD